MNGQTTTAPTERPDLVAGPGAGVIAEPAPLAWHLRDWIARGFDVAVALALLVVGSFALLVPTSDIAHADRLTESPLQTFGLLALSLAALLPRRRFPLPTLALVSLCIVAEGWSREPLLSQPVLLVAVYTVASRLRWRIAVPSLAAALVMSLLAISLSRDTITLANVVSAIVMLGSAAVVGLYVGTRQRYMDALRERARHLDRERELVAARAVADERVHIARELHDVIAHHVSLLVVQASALELQLAADDPGRETARSMAAGGRQALDEMRRMLGVLRTGGGATPPAERSPQPVVAELPALVDQVRGAGLRIALTVEGVARQLPSGIDLCAFRVAQEAITNVVKHAPHSECQVTVVFGADHLEIRVTNSAESSPSDSGRDGHGLVGMRERVALYGGELFAGPVPGGGFAVRATFAINPGIAEA